LTSSLSSRKLTWPPPRRNSRSRLAPRLMQSERYRFGLYELNATTCELRREGRVVRLQSQPAQLLAFLVARAGQVVSREHLQRAIWGADTFVDFERGLNFCVAQIRSALNDDSANPVFLRTIPKQGYQFIAPVEPLDDRLAEAQPAAFSANPASSRS